MKHSFDLDNFESFLSEQADRHRMYANDRVWRNIQQSLHGAGKWPALTFASILTLAFLAVVLTISYPNRQLIQDQSLAASIQSETSTSGNIAKSITTQGAPKIKSPVASSRGAGHSLSVANYVLTEPVENTAEPVEKFVSTFNAAVQKRASIEDETTEAGRPGLIPVVTADKTSLQEKAEFPNLNIKAEPASVMSTREISEKANTSLASTPESFTFNEEPIEKIAEKNFINSSMGYGPNLPAELNKKQSRWALQLYATPSISYRYLLEDKKYVDDPSLINGPLAPYLTNSVNQFVSQKPKMGFEIGAAVLYRLSDNLRIKSGLQLNYRQFGINAYATAQMQPAILALNRGNGIDSLTRYTNISTQSGYKPIEISSNFLQLALPVGFDLKLAQANKFGFYVSAAGQLTWQLASNSYLVSADYKNYLKHPALDRRFNINTAVEAFVSFDAGGVTWQAGPQIRYQLLPGSTNAYPVREHLVDYGMKVGIVKTLK